MIVTEKSPIKITDVLNKTRMSSSRKNEVYELLEEFKNKKQLERLYIYEKNLWTAMCWLQFNQLASITHIQEPNGQPRKIYYGLTTEIV